MLARRRALGPLWVVAPVAYGTDPEAADRMAGWLCEASGLAAAEEVKAILRDAGQGDTRREYGSTWSIHEEGIGSVLFTAYGLADVYSRLSVLATAARSDFTAADLMNGRPATLIVVAPESDADRFASLLTALIASVVHEAEQQAAQRGGPVEPRLLLALDEAANVFRFPRLPALLTTARGNGIQLLLAYHDLGQLEHVTGSKEVAPLWGDASGPNAGDEPGASTASPPKPGSTVAPSSATLLGRAGRVDGVVHAEVTGRAG